MHSKSQCDETRTRIERSVEDVTVERHLAACAGCAEFAALERWSRQVLRAGEVTVTPPLMSAVWASIHRASEQAWDSALSRSFRHLLPYMVAVVALILLVGGLTYTRTPQPVLAASAAYAALNAPEVPAVASVMTATDLSSQDVGDILGVRH